MATWPRSPRRLSAALATLQIAPGDRVVAQIEKSPEAIALYLACLQQGAAFVPLNTAYTFAELEYFLGDAAPSRRRRSTGRPTTGAANRAALGVKHVETLDERGGGTLLTAVQEETTAPRTSSQHDRPRWRRCCTPPAPPAAPRARCCREPTSLRTPRRWRKPGSSLRTTCCCTHCRYFTCMDCLSRSIPCSPRAARCCSCLSSTPMK